MFLHQSNGTKSRRNNAPVSNWDSQSHPSSSSASSQPVVAVHKHIHFLSVPGPRTNSQHFYLHNIHFLCLILVSKINFYDFTEEKKHIMATMINICMYACTEAQRASSLYSTLIHYTQRTSLFVHGNYTNHRESEASGDDDDAKKQLPCHSVRLCTIFFAVSLSLTTILLLRFLQYHRAHSPHNHRNIIITGKLLRRLHSPPPPPRRPSPLAIIIICR